MTLLEKIFYLFGRNTDSYSVKGYQAQFKPTINDIGVNLSHNNEAPRISANTFDIIVVGVSFNQEALEKICDSRRVEGAEMFVQAKIISYDDNPYDPHAVRVEIDHEPVGHLSRKNARIWRSKMISNKYSGAVTCPAKIVWDRGAYKEGSYGVWLDLDLALSDSKPEVNIAQTVSVPGNHPDHIEFLVNKLNRFELSNCKVGDDVNLWVAEGTREIFIYRQGTDFGEGKIGICPDELFKTICDAPGCDARIVSIYEEGCKISCKLISKAEMEEIKTIQSSGEKETSRSTKRPYHTRRVFSYRFRHLLVFHLQPKWHVRCDRNLGAVQKNRGTYSKVMPGKERQVLQD